MTSFSTGHLNPRQPEYKLSFYNVVFQTLYNETSRIRPERATAAGQPHLLPQSHGKTGLSVQRDTHVGTFGKHW